MNSFYPDRLIFVFALFYALLVPAHAMEVGSHEENGSRPQVSFTENPPAEPSPFEASHDHRAQNERAEERISELGLPPPCWVGDGFDQEHLAQIRPRDFAPTSPTQVYIPVVGYYPTIPVMVYLPDASHQGEGSCALCAQGYLGVHRWVGYSAELVPLSVPVFWVRADCLGELSRETSPQLPESSSEEIRAPVSPSAVELQPNEAHSFETGFTPVRSDSFPAMDGAGEANEWTPGPPVPRRGFMRRWFARLLNSLG